LKVDEKDIEMDIRDWVNSGHIPNDIDVHVLRNLGDGDVGFFHSKQRQGVCIRFFPPGSDPTSKIRIHIMPLGCEGKTFVLGMGENEYFSKEDARLIWNELLLMGYSR
jgi:hypothetical protein